MIAKPNPKMMIYKVCRKCDKLKPVTNFYGDKTRYDGKCAVCKPCANIRKNNWRKANPEKRKAEGARWRAKHPNYQKEWIARNPDYHSTYATRRGPLYHTWKSMKQRCNNPNDSDYQCYGGRGIKVCDRWAKSYDDFESDMGEKPSKDHSIDRIDPDGNYEPGNVRWATSKQQARNRRKREPVPF